ncbi:Ribosomal protein S7 (mitochondrion) [Coccomyxa sp. Obi]|nr:Ribosomal protein S7 [Coccomyxa sp. Obi]
MNQFKHTCSRTKLTRVQSITSERLPVQQDLQEATLHLEELGSSINNARGLSLRGQANELFDHRLLTGKLGGWRHGPSSGRESTQQAHHQGERRAVSHRVYLHAAPRTLPSYLIKLINQLMRHGKKGLSVGLLADSLTLFLKRLEEGVESNTRNDVLKTAILSKQMGEQGKTASREGLIQSKDVPSFPFYSVSFPGARFGDMFSSGNIQSNTLLGLPFSGTLSPHYSNIRLSFIEKGGKYRGSLGFEGAQNLDAGKDQFLSILFDIPAFVYAPASWAGNRKEQSINQKTLIFGKKQSPTSVVRRSNPSRVEIGLRSHTQKPIYFWHMEGFPALPLRLNSSKSVKLEGSLSPIQPRLVECESIAPQASILDSLSRAIANVEPSLEVRKKKIAGITRQIPCVVSKSRGERLAIRWIINSARERVKKRGKGLPYCLAEELMDAYHKRGEPRQKRDSLHKAAESNRSFLRYRWW